MNDTIWAYATAAGRSAVAVARVSGPGAAACLKALTARALPSSRRASLRLLVHPVSGAPIDRALVLWFPGPGSYTGEDSAEFHVHGGGAVVAALASALEAAGARLAEPGEFTRRAFESGRMDLSQAEAVADLVDAETEAQRRQALDQLGGALAGVHARWRSGLAALLAVLEAGIDFPDEEIPPDLLDEAVERAAGLAEELRDTLRDARRGQGVRDGFRVAIIGAPNAGKSSLLNALLDRPAAIVTATPGTTRDVIEAPIDVAGYRVLIADTAGLRSTGEAIEAEGVRRAEQWARSADLRLFVVDGASSGSTWRSGEALAARGDVCVLNKQDAGSATAAVAARAWAESIPMKVVSASAARGEVHEVWTALREVVVDALAGAEFPPATRRRHAEALEEAADALERATALLEIGGEVELAAEDVRLGARALERIAGRIAPDDVLGEVFGRFCIGK